MPKLLIIARVELFPRPLRSIILQAGDFWGPADGCLVGEGSTPQLQAGWCVGRPMGYKEGRVPHGVSAEVLELVGTGSGMMGCGGRGTLGKKE